MEILGVSEAFHDATKFASPSTVTILPTYTCTAACKECCFESSPRIKERLSRDELFKSIDKAISDLLDLKLIVFSGGECFTLLIPTNLNFDVIISTSEPEKLINTIAKKGDRNEIH